MCFGCLKSYSLRNGYEAHNWFGFWFFDGLGAGANEGVEPKGGEDCRGGVGGAGGGFDENPGGIWDEESIFVARGSEAGDWRGGTMDTG